MREYVDKARPNLFFEGYLTEELVHNPPVEIGSGGEQTVFTHELLGDNVVKIGHYMLTQPFNKYAMERRVPTDGVGTRQWDEARKLVSGTRIRYAALREVFGAEHVPEETICLGSVPLSGRTLKQLGIDNSLPDSDTRWFWTTVRHQEKLPALLQPEAYNVHDFGVGYAEKVGPDMASDLDYLVVNRRWIEQPQSNEDATVDEWRSFLAVQGNDSIQTLMKLLDDDSFRSAFTDFLTRVHQFSDLAGEALDANKNNIIFYQTPGEDAWNYSLVDALCPQSQNNTHGNLDMSRYILRQFAGSAPVAPYEYKILLNTLGFVRTVNALSEYLYLPQRIELSPSRFLDETWRYITTSLAHL